MGNIITQYSRIKHHTITTGTFSVPVTEDFTQGVWTATDLCRSEFGIKEDTREVFVRIDDEVVQLRTENPSVGLFPVILGTMSANGLTGSYENIFNYDIPAGIIEDGNGIHIRVGMRTDSNSDPKEVRLQFAGQDVWADSGTLNDIRIVNDFDLIRGGSDAYVSGLSQLNGVSDAGVGPLFGINWGITQSVSVGVSASNPGDIELFTVKIMLLK
jgi:hypothetical protein